MTEPSTSPGLGCDMSHPAVGSVQAWLSTARHRSPQGEFLVATFRVPNTTLTVLLSKADAQAWIDQMQGEVDQMSSLMIAPANAPMPDMRNANGHPL